MGVQRDKLKLIYVWIFLVIITVLFPPWSSNVVGISSGKIVDISKEGYKYSFILTPPLFESSLGIIDIRGGSTINKTIILTQLLVITILCGICYYNERAFSFLRPNLYLSNYSMTGLLLVLILWVMPAILINIKLSVHLLTIPSFCLLPRASRP